MTLQELFSWQEQEPYTIRGPRRSKYRNIVPGGTVAENKSLYLPVPAGARLW